jgi:hypothetical protein
MTTTVYAHRFDNGMAFLEEAVTAPYGEAHWT